MLLDDLYRLGGEVLRVVEGRLLLPRPLQDA